MTPPTEATPAPLRSAPPAPHHARGTTATVRRDALVTAALAYAERGWHVFPLRPDDKRPAFPHHPETACTATDPRCARAGRHVSWEERATTDPLRIRTAWTRSPYGIGIACGPSGLVVLDLDTPKPNRDGDLPAPPAPWDQPGIVDGADVFAALCAAGGHRFPLGGTYTVHTARSGLHLYFAHPPAGPPLRCTAGALGWLIDTRAHGGYVVAPPSTANGRPYVAEDDSAAVRPLPDWLGETLTPAPLPAQEPVSVRLHSTGDGRRDRYRQAALERCVDAVRASGDGQHNRALYGAAVQLGQLVAGGELTADEVLAALLPAGTEVGQPESQARQTIASGLKSGANRPRTTTQGAAA